MPRKRRPSELLGPAAYASLWMMQGKRCAIKGCTAQPRTRAFPVDHDHRTHVVRGILCPNHNRRLWRGATPDELRAMADYLDNHHTGMSLAS